MNDTPRISRRRFLRGALVGTALVGAPALAPLLARAAPAPFSIVVLPDTQFYVRYDGPSHRPGIFTGQTDWIVQNLASENIAFVTHVGDVVNNGAAQPIEWERANDALDRLHGRVPYSVVPGNHDFNRVSSRSSGLSAFVQHYGRARYGGMSWYGGSSSDQANHYQFFEAGSWRFLHLGLELEPSNTTITWAKSVLAAHAGLPTIITTHSYQNDSTGRTTTSQFQGNNGEQQWQKLVKLYPQIFMVLNGHFYAKDGERHQVSTNNAGLPVYEMISDYQHYSDGGRGYLRVIRFDPGANTISVRSYSPWLNHFMTDSDSQFSFSVDLARRFGGALSPTATPSATATITPTASPTPAPGGETRVFTCSADAPVYASAPDRNYGGYNAYTITAGTPLRQAYLRFNVSGLTAPVASATLRLFIPTNGTTNGPLVALTSNDWSEYTITWNNRPAPGSTVANAGSLNPGGWAEYDVSSAIVGDGVYSFALVGESSDGVEFASREATQKPQLVVATR
jgi:hypothetical protein